VTADVQRRLDDAVTLARKAQRERALAIGEMRNARLELECCELSLRNALLELSCARELLAYHGLTVVEEAV
jgi:polysaccharide deacetylase 2 family uncharacterized protein YibQ